MEIITTQGFLKYYQKTRAVTLGVIKVIPPDQLNWSYMPGKFTIGDLVRHIAAIERFVFAEVATGKQPRYSGCGKELADGYHEVISFFNEMHAQSMALFDTIGDDSLASKVTSLDGKTIELRNFLRALIVHEVHHRGALCIYLNLLGIDTPPVIGLKEEEVKLLSQ